MNKNREIVKKKHRVLADRILEAQERRDRGEPSGAFQVQQLKVERATAGKELRQADNKDYLDRTRQRRERRYKFEKMIDALRGDL